MAAGALFLTFLVVGVGLALLLYVFVRREAKSADRMSREEARERVSREQSEGRNERRE